MPPDPFALLGLPRTFDLDRDRIERAYLARSAAIHPDLVGPGADAQAAAHASAADLNHAARTLRDPEARANVLLTLLGGPAKVTDRSLPDGFLQGILGVRLEIEESASDPAARVKWEAWAQSQRDEYAARCRDRFAALASPPKAQDLREIRRILNAWRYIERLIEQMDPGYDPARADFPRP